MRFEHKITGDIVELPPPDRLGDSCVIFNGKVVMKIRYADHPGRTITEDGRIFYGDAWAAFVTEQLRIGAWRDTA
jgi:hypothetical protein